MPARQQLLHVWLSGGTIGSEILAWSFHDGTDGAGPALPDGEPPYRTGLDALRDGWMVIQAVPPPPAGPDPNAPNGHLDHEFLLERRIEGPAMAQPRSRRPR